MARESTYVPFSQRYGLNPTPPQLKLGEVSEELRRILAYCFQQEIEKGLNRNSYYRTFTAHWRSICEKYWVFHLNQRIEKIDYTVEKIELMIFGGIYNLNLQNLFDMIEFFVRHENVSEIFRIDVADAFVVSRAAYRIVDGQIVAIGNEEQGAAFERSLADAEKSNATAARAHLIAAGSALRDGDWPASIRESINAVEAMAIKLEPKATTLGEALAKLERKGRLHASLKQAFGKLYGYSSDEEGIRHALVFNEKANVDEADALFMLGACASFVSYLIAQDISS